MNSNEIITTDGLINSRRTFLKLGLGGGAAAMTFLASPLSMLTARAGGTPAGDIDVLNYALTLERLEYAFYRDGLPRFREKDFRFVACAITSRSDEFRADDHHDDDDCGDDDMRKRVSRQVYAYLKLIRDHEKAHVETLVSVIRSLGGTPVPELRYNFGYYNAQGFLQVAQALENTGVMAYDGAIALIDSPELQTAGATIATVEARHAAYLNLVNGAVPFPEAFDQPKTMAQILAMAGQFIRR